ncbi:unnamed protein product, partial [marine sediment metagenome]
KIREGLRDLLLHIHITPELTIDDLTDDVLKYFNDKVVIKADRELPLSPILNITREQRDYLRRAGCGFFEPLIEDVKSE